MAQFLSVDQMFWQGSFYRYIFYASVILILIFEKRTTYKIVLGFFPLLITVGLFNPVTSAVVALFFSKPDVYYVRLFSVIPLFYCMAHAATLMIKKTTGAVKLALVCVSAVIIIVAGHSIYREPWMERAENPEKVPTEAVKVVEAIPREKSNVCVAFPDPLYLYARQIDASIQMPYGRELSGNSNPLLNELNNPVPDPLVVMTQAGNAAVDYVVVNKSDDSVACFANSGHVPVAETDQYCIYPVTGVERKVLEYNDKRQIISNTACDAQGNPTYSANRVITKYVIENDRLGNDIKTEYYDRNGNRVTFVDGHAGVRKLFKLVGLSWAVDSELYLDALDQPVLIQGRYVTKYDYNRYKQVVRESYYNIDGQPMKRLDKGYAAVLKRYDDKNRLVSEQYVDERGNPVTSSEGYATYVRWFDDHDRCIAEEYFDANGNVVRNKDGFAGFTRTYGKKGTVREEIYFDENSYAIDIQSLIDRNDSRNLLQRLEKHSVENAVGICYQWNDDGSCHVSGKSEGITWNSLIEGDRPYFLRNGADYRIEYASENVVLRIYFYEDLKMRNMIESLAVKGNEKFTVPRNCSAMIMRLWVAAGVEVDETVRPQIQEVTSSKR